MHHAPQIREAARLQFLRAAQVRDQLAISNTTLYKFVLDGLLPPPISIGGGRATAWLQSDVDSFVESRIKASRPAQKEVLQ